MRRSWEHQNKHKVVNNFFIDIWIIDSNLYAHEFAPRSEVSNAALRISACDTNSLACPHGTFINHRRTLAWIYLARLNSALTAQIIGPARRRDSFQGSGQRRRETDSRGRRPRQKSETYITEIKNVQAGLLNLIQSKSQKFFFLKRHFIDFYVWTY